jgi:hypothetical protein
MIMRDGNAYAHTNPNKSEESSDSPQDLRKERSVRLETTWGNGKNKYALAICGDQN